MGALTRGTLGVVVVVALAYAAALLVPKPPDFDGMTIDPLRPLRSEVEQARSEWIIRSLLLEPGTTPQHVLGVEGRIFRAPRDLSGQQLRTLVNALQRLRPRPDGAAPGQLEDVVVYHRADFATSDDPSEGWTGAVVLARQPERCFTVVGADQLVGSGRGELARALQICSWYDVYGPPGSALHQWLFRQRLRPLEGTPLPRIPKVTGWYVPWTGNTWFTEITPGLWWPVLLGSAPYHFGFAGTRCLAGSRPDCVTAIVEARAAAPSPQGYAASGGFFEVYMRQGEPEANPTVSGGFLSSLVAEFGREAFERFWRAETPFEQAFEAAFGVPLGDWTYRWALESHNGSGLARQTRPVWLGATVGLDAVLATVGWAALLVLVIGRSLGPGRVTARRSPDR